MRLSGPVDAVRINFFGREYILLADRHNSISGSCPGKCTDLTLNNELISGKDNCESVLHFLSRYLEQGADFFLEASFVIKDAPRPSKISGSLDYIDRMLFLFHDSFLRNKTLTGYPKSFLHYVDVRDLFLGTYNEPGTREMVSANPFSGSVVVRAFRDCQEIKDYFKVYQEGVVLLKYVLDHAWDYFNSYTTENKNFPVPQQRGPLFEEYRRRLARISMLNSNFQGKRISRVAKQLFKLAPEKRKMILDWARETFQRELEISWTIYEEWIAAMKKLAERSLSLDEFSREFEEVRMHPISCLVALSSVIMDIYILSRSFYHQHTPVTIFYCGAAHIENHISFFKKYGGTVTERSESPEHLERCILMI